MFLHITDGTAVSEVGSGGGGEEDLHKFTLPFVGE